MENFVPTMWYVSVKYSLLLFINLGRVCDKGLCFKTEPSAERPGQPAKTCFNTAAYTATTWNGM